jgi:hypothetical protein
MDIGCLCWEGCLGTPNLLGHINAEGVHGYGPPDVAALINVKGVHGYGPPGTVALTR